MDVTLTKTRIRAGWWEGVLKGSQASVELEVVLLGEILQGVTIVPIPGAGSDLAVRVPIPAEMLNDGVQTFVIRQKGGDTLTHFTIITGVAMEDDLRAEIDLMRAELDMLKRAFRRHCVETAS
jgi:hypothetical protein